MRERVGEIAGVADTDERLVAGLARRHQQDVGAVGEQAEADDDPAQLALQHEVGADTEQRRRGERQQNTHSAAPREAPS